jgi:hypothetical protein
VGASDEDPNCYRSLDGTRYHALAREVLERLPDGRALYREYGLEVSKSPPPKPGIYAGALRLEANETSPDDPSGEQVWVVTPCGSISIGGIGYNENE